MKKTYLFLILSFYTLFELMGQTCPTTIKVGSTCSCHTCTGTIDVVNYETYCKRVLPQEWYNCWGSLTNGMNSLQAGAVAIRSYTIPRMANYVSSHGGGTYDICTTTCCHVYGTTQYTNSNNAVNNTANMVLVSGSTIQSTEYAAEQNNHPSCGDGHKGNGTSSWPCTADGPCTGKTYNGHGRGACQWGTARWATGDVLSSCSLAGSHGYGTKTWQQILSHYYPNWTLASCGSVAPPSNNNCSGAQTLTVYSTSSCGGATTGTISGATQSIAPLSCGGYTSTLCTDVWYKFTATTTAHTITVVPSSGMDAVVDLRSGACNGSNIACADIGGGHGATEVIYATGLTAGTTYYVRVYDYTGSSVPPTTYTFTICVTTPTPPQCAITSFSPASITHDPTSFSSNITVNANANCAYTVTGVCPWLSVTPASGYANISGQFTLACTVQANNSASARTCTFLVNSTPYTITQNGCAYNLSPASNSVSASGSTYNLSISTSSPCSWTVTNPCSSWVNISQSSGTGQEAFP
ncbi:MAG TPA: SpoIID/LytB domain-containing protein [Bacteroidales bacterium]|nr:SpoIID/LytB domain-containing protein [Bacteroidales bacterium]